MSIYGVPFTGSAFVEAATPEQALAAVREWSEAVLRASMTEQSLPCGETISLVIVRPHDSPIRDATDVLNGLVAEARREG